VTCIRIGVLLALLTVFPSISSALPSALTGQDGGNDPVTTISDGATRGWPGGDYFPNHAPGFTIVKLIENNYLDDQSFPNGYYFKYACFNADGTRIAVTTRNRLSGVSQPYEIWLMDCDAVTQTVSNFQQITSTAGIGDVYENSQCSWSKTNSDILLYLEVHVSTANIIRTYDVSTGIHTTLYDPALDTNGYDVTNPAFYAGYDDRVVFGSGYNTGNDRILLFDGTYPSVQVSSADKNLDPSTNYDGTRVTYYSTQATYAQGSIFADLIGPSWTENVNGFGDPTLSEVPGYWAFYSGQSSNRIAALRASDGWSAVGLGLYSASGNLIEDLLGDGGTDFKWIYANHNWGGPQGEILFRAEEYTHDGYGNHLFIAFGKPMVVYVDDDWTGPADCGGNAWGYNAFATIQDGIDGVAETGTVNVADGLYLASNTTVNKPVTIVGANAGTVTVAPAAEDDNLTATWDGGYQHGFIIDADDVAISSLTIDGEGNPALTAGRNNFRVGIITASGVSHANARLDDITIAHVYFRGLHISESGTAEITGCRVSDVEAPVYNAYGLLLLGNCIVTDNTFVGIGGRAIGTAYGDGTVSSNVVNGAMTGIYNYNYGYSDRTVTAFGNEISNVTTGINLVGQTATTIIGGPTPAEANTIDLTAVKAAFDPGIERYTRIDEAIEGPGADRFESSSRDDNAAIGVLVWYTNASTIIEGNAITANNGDAGFWLFHNEDSLSPVIIRGNTATAATSDGTVIGEGTGIFMTDDGTLFGDENGTTYTTLEYNTISGFARGIDFYRNAATPLEGRNVNSAVVGNTLTGNGTGLRTNGGRLLSLIGNVIADNTGDGVLLTTGLIAPTLADCHSNDLGGNGGFGVNNTTAALIDASGNWWGGADALTVSAAAGALVDYTPWLDTDTEDPLTGTDDGFQGDFSVLWVDDNSPQAAATTRIQEAIDETGAVTVQVLDGTYGADPITGAGATIAKDGITLNGQTEAGTIIDGAVGNVGTSGAYWPKGVHILGNNVVVQNLTVQGFTGDLIATGGYGIVFRDYDHDDAGEGYVFYDNCIAQNVTVQNCYSAIYSLCFTNLTVAGATVQDNEADGMFIARGSDGAEIHDNTVTNSGDHGIWVGYSWTAVLPSHNALIYDNVVDGAQEGGISFVASDNAEIYGNTITNVAADGWAVGALSLKDGPTNVNAHDNIITGNDGAWNGYAGLGHGVGIDGGADGIALHNNTITGNTGLGVYNASAKAATSVWIADRLVESGLPATADHMATSAATRAVIDAECNWWGSITGPYHPTANALGLGSQVSDNVDFEPWSNADFSLCTFTSTPTEVWVDDDYVDSGENDGHYWGYDAFDNVMEAVTHVAAAGTIHVAAGTYVEQVHITKPDLFIDGADVDNVVIQSPASLADYFVTGTQNNHPVVFVDGVDLALSGLTIDGANQGDANYRFVGLAFWNGGGSGNDLKVVNVMNAVFSGAQHGIGIYSNNDDDLPHAIALQDVTVDLFQKGAVALSGAGLTVDLDNVSCTGAGPTDVTAQNGIQIGTGVSGTMDNCSITGIHWTGDTWTASGLLVFGDLDATGTAIDQCQTSVYVQDGNCLFDGGTITNPAGDVLIAYSTAARSAGAAVKQPATVKPYDGVPEPTAERAPVTTTISNSTITGTGAADSYGIYAYAVGPVAFTVTNNEISNFDVAVSTWEVGGTVTTDISGNSLHDNLYAIASNAVVTQDASGNWYGTIVPAEVAAMIDGPIDYSPWLDDGTDVGAPVGFQGDFSKLWVDEDSPVSGGDSHIAEGMLLADGIAPTVMVAPGDYAEAVTIASGFNGGTLEGSADTIPVLGSGVTLADALSGATLRGLSIRGQVPTHASVVRALGNVTDLTIETCVIDGENVIGRHGYSGGALYGDFIFTDNEIKNVLGWSVLDSKSGSGGGGSPLATVTFTDNNVHNCNGSVALRGDEVDWTDHVIISGNTFDAIGGNEGQQGEQWAAIEVNRATLVDFFDNTIENVVLGVWDEGQAVQLWAIDELDMHGNTIIDNAQGIFVYGGDGDHAIPAGSMYDNTIVGNAAYGLSVDPTATGGPLNAACNYWGSISGPYNDPANLAGTGDEVLGNVTYEPWSDELFSSCTFVANPAEVWVKASYSAGFAGGHVWQYDAFSSLQDAVTFVGDGGLIHLLDGDYYEQVTVGKDITISGEGDPVLHPPTGSLTGYTIDESSATFYPILLAYGGTLDELNHIGGPDTISVQISGVTTNGDNGVVVSRFVGIMLRNCRATDLTDCQALGGLFAAGNPQTFGILIYGASDVNVSGCTVDDWTRGGIGIQGDGAALTDPTAAVTGNTVIGRGPVDVGNWAQNGIQFGYGASGTITDNEVSGIAYIPTDWSASGIILYEAAPGIVMTGNNVHDCEGALQAYYTDQLTINDGNTFAGNDFCFILGGDAIDLDGNTFSGNSQALYLADPTNVIIHGNTFDANEYAMIMDGSTADVTFTENNVTANTEAAFYIDEYGGYEPAGIAINNNHFSGNAYGVQNLTTVMVDATANWWGDPTGPATGLKRDVSVAARPQAISAFDAKDAPVAAGRQQDLSVNRTVGTLAATAGSGDAVSVLVDYSPWWGADYIGNPHTAPWTIYVDTSNGSTIQEGVEYAIAGDIINATAGLYVEQVVVTKNDLTINGVGYDTEAGPVTVVQAPPLLAYSFNSSTPESPVANHPIIGVDGATGVKVRNMKIDGAGLGNDNYRFEGVAFWNAGGEISDCHITGVQNTPFSGAQHGVAVYAYNNRAASTYLLSISGCVIDAFQKNAMALSGDGLTVTISDCQITGAGLTGITAQNGIQIGYGAGGSVSGCSIIGIAYDDVSWTASGMLLYQGTNVAVTGGCSVTASQSCIVFQETSGSVVGATVTTSGVNNEEAISIRDYGYAKVDQDALTRPVSAWTEPGYVAAKGILPTVVTLDSLTLTGADHAESYGVAAWALGDPVTVTMTNSTLSSWGTGVVAYEDGSACSFTAHDNLIADNAEGVWSNTVANIDFEYNDWGATDGPSDTSGTNEATINTCFDVGTMTNKVAELDPASGLGNAVVGNVDYCPWNYLTCCITRGDVDHSGNDPNVSDITYLVSYLFTSGPAAPCEEEADVDNSGTINVSDLTYLVAFLFQGGTPPPPC